MNKLTVGLLVLVGIVGGWLVGTRWAEVVALVAPQPATEVASVAVDTELVAPSDTDEATASEPVPAPPPTQDRVSPRSPATPVVPFPATPAGVQALFDGQAHRLEQACYLRLRRKGVATHDEVAHFAFHVWVDVSDGAPGIVHIAAAPETEAVLTSHGRTIARSEAGCLVRALVDARAVGPVPARTPHTIPLYGKTPLGGLTYARFSVKLPVFVR